MDLKSRLRVLINVIEEIEPDRKRAAELITKYHNSMVVQIYNSRLKLPDCQISITRQ